MPKSQLFQHYLMHFYYLLKPCIPRRVQLYIRHKIAGVKREYYRDIWPIDRMSYSPPPFWQGWPCNKKFALVLTHDIDTARGLERVKDLVKLEKNLGFQSAFYIVPERYHFELSMAQQLINEDFEVGVHGLKHDGKLFKDYKTFHERAVKINNYIWQWNVNGFRAPCMHHNLEWLHELDIQYDASTFDTDPFEPQPDGVGTIYPFVVDDNATRHRYIELPYTLPQDCTLFNILREKNIDVWKRKLNWIVEKGGMAMLITHPDYMSFNGARQKVDEYPAEFYEEFLHYILLYFKDQYWHALPRDVAKFWQENYISKHATQYEISA